MKKTIFAIIALTLVMAFKAFSENVIIKEPSWLKGKPIRSGCPVFPDSLCFDSEAEELNFPDLGAFVCLGDYNFPNVRRVTLGNVDYMPGGAFVGMPNLEEVIIDGFCGHIDGTFVIGCPKLKRIVFNGPMSGTGGPGFATNCPNLEVVEFNGVVGKFDMSLFDNNFKEKLHNFTNNAAFLSVYNDSLTPKAQIEQLVGNPCLLNDLDVIARWQCDVLNSPVTCWRRAAYSEAKVLLPVLQQVGSKEAPALKDAMEYAWSLGDEVKTNLEILKESPAYASDSVGKPQFAYVLPTDSLLTAARLYFNLDSIAGSGDDVSRIKNLLYWVHDNIRYDGSNGFPSGSWNLKNFYNYSRRDSCGYNCRALAISLTEALLAEGIPARYLTCQSKAWDTDEDCHVICVAWSKSLGKWIWLDPTFAATVTDENGLLLHPGEVRYRLQHDMPLILNEDANWNNLYKETKESYLEDYMAKNLYILSANLLNQSEPEGKSDHLQGYTAALVPQGSNYKNSYYIFTDEDWFWQSPSKWYEQSLPKSELKVR